MINSPVYQASISQPNGFSYEPSYRQDAYNRIAPALQERFKTDPALKAPGMPPNYGEFPLPHVMTLQGLVTTISRVYRISDEALNDSFDNARFMEYDVGIWECMQARIRSSVLLDWHIDPENEMDPEQVRICGELGKIVHNIDLWHQFLWQLGLAIWYGRSGVQIKPGWKQVNGAWRILPLREGEHPGWLPIHGDKLVFRLMDGSLTHLQNQVGIRVGQTYTMGDRIAKGPGLQGEYWQVEPTDRGLAYFLTPAEQKLVVIHKHQLEDAAFDRPQDAGRIHGTGLRNLIYWEWFMKQETLRWLMEYLERSAFGLELWYYPLGNEKARQDAETAVKNRSGPFRNALFVPVPAEDAGTGKQFGVDHIETGLAGAEVLMSIIEKYFFHRQKRLILGQTLTTEAEATGLGGNLASIHLLSFRDIVKYDCKNRDSTVTRFVNCIKNWNFPGNNHWQARYVTETEPVDADEKLAALKECQAMGAPVTVTAIYKAAGVTPPQPGEQLAQMPGMMPMGGPEGAVGGPDVTPDEGLQPDVEGPQAPEGVAYQIARYSDQEWHKSLSDDEKESIKDYALDSSVNDRLRAGIPNRHDDKMTDLLDSALEKATLKSPTVLLHGTSKKIKVGDEWTNHGYTSATKSEAIAHDFAERKRGHVVHLHLPSGFNAGYVGSLSTSHASEGEYLIPRGTRFKAVAKIGGHIHAEPIQDRPEGTEEPPKIQKTLYSQSTTEQPDFFQTLKSLPGAGHGELFGVKEMRDKLPHLSKDEFDNQALALRKERKLVLHKHDYVAPMKTDELHKHTIFQPLGPFDEARGTGDHPKGLYYVGMALGPDHREESAKYALTDTPEFHNWFGGSKVVDAHGKPLTVYHGATQDFHEFQPNSFFSDKPETAGGFAIRRAEHAGEENPKPRTIPVHLNLQNPHVIDAQGEHAGNIQFAHNDKHGYRKALADSKYDGIIIKNTADEGNLYLAKHPHQIKSAIGNKGTFDPSDSRITYSEEYQINHRPSSEGPPAHNLLEGDVAPSDIYSKPHYYGAAGDKKSLVETIATLRKARGKPDSLISVYRASPKPELNHGDWVTLSKSYAQSHAKHATDPSQDMPVHEHKVPASHVRFDGDDLHEFGYFPSKEETAKYSEEGAELQHEIGTQPIPKDHIRLFHYTRGNAADIRKQGLQLSHARGNTYGEPNLVWGSTNQPGQHHTIVEYHIHRKDPAIKIGKPHDSETIDDIHQGTNHIAVDRDIKPEEILEVHEPWHHIYHYIKQNSDVYKAVLAGEHDSLMEKDDNGEYKFHREGPATAKIKEEAGLPIN